MFKLKRQFALLLCLLLVAFAASAVSAQAPFVNITSPAANAVIADLSSPVAVTVNFGNLPEGGSARLEALDETHSTVLASSQEVPTIIPWETSLNLSAVTPGSTGLSGGLYP